MENVNSVESPLETSTSNDEKPLSDYYIAASIMLTIALCGLTANISAIKIIWESKSLHNCFGYLLLLHASAEALVLFSFIFWAVPITFFDRSLSKSVLGMKIGHVVIVIYYITLYAQLFKAVNRLYAIYNPVVYRRWFSDENSKFILLGVLFMSLIHGIVFFFPGCNFYFDGDNFTWAYDDTPCRDILAIYIDFIVGCSVMGITISIDSYTLSLVIKHGMLNGKKNKEVKFFLQAFSTSILYTVMLIIVQLISRLSTTTWQLFGTVTLTWEICHAVDGILMIAFNLRRKKDTQASTVISRRELDTRAPTKIQ